MCKQHAHCSLLSQCMNWLDYKLSGKHMLLSWTFLKRTWYYVGVQIRSVHLACASQQHSNQHVCIIVIRCGMCFWDCQPRATKREQCEDSKGYVEIVRRSEWGFNTSPKAGMWLFLKMATRFFASAPLFPTHGSRLHGVVAAFWLSALLLFSHQCSSSFSLSPQILTLRQWDCYRCCSAGND